MYLIQLVEKSQAVSGLYIGNKIKREHLHLTSYSRMNVRLAVQVLHMALSLNVNVVFYTDSYVLAHCE